MTSIPTCPAAVWNSQIIDRGVYLQLIKEQAQIVIRKVKVQTVLDQNLHSFYFPSCCWLREIVTTERLDPAAAGEISDGVGLA